MPWKECQIVEERLRFIARLLEGEKMAAYTADFMEPFVRMMEEGLSGKKD